MRRTTDRTTAEYKAIKEELSKRCSCTRYFTKAFYQMFIECRRKMQKNAEAGIDDSYIKDGYIKLYRAYDPVYASDFYNKNSGTYCEFLSIVH